MFRYIRNQLTYVVLPTHSNYEYKPCEKTSKISQAIGEAQKLVRVNFNTKEKICLSNLDKHERLDLGESPKNAPMIDGFMSEGFQAFRSDCRSN